jgi:hypothetical protein
MTATAHTTTATWRQAGESRDPALVTTCLAKDVQVISPLAAQFRFTGRDQVLTMLTAAFRVIDSIRYHTEVGDDRTKALFYYGHCRGVDFEEAQLLRFDDQGLIVEVTMFGRPLPGLTTVMAAIGPELLQAGDRPALAKVIGATTAPLAAITRLAEKRMAPLADPNR